ncbi:MAG: peptide chain release factor N(5)-glutamine methyltransferase [Oscillibacter sp.]|nr:peptide chain release factor N(5)-glutamine methyltransferase [Oscillibacter sp.]MBQ2996716.1 peptide chain release factor N(5)-glutamine methyltransferase [Oscillibacter sp.]
MAITYNDLYLDIRRELRLAGIAASTLEARELVCFGTGKTKEQLQMDGRLYASPETEKRVRDLMRRHLAGEPVAYLIGEWEFFGLPLDISSDVLIPRPDTEVLAQEVIDYLAPRSGEKRVLDLCAGSGCIGLAVASQVENCRVVLGDYSEPALKICRQNIRRNGLSGRVVPMQMDALAKPDRALGEFHCIVSNPPYIPSGDIAGLDVSVKNYEPHMALDGGEDGLDFYRSIVQQWKEALVPNGRLYFEVGIGQADDVLRIMRKEGFGDIQVVKDLNDIPRVVFGTLRGSSETAVFGD